MRLPSWKPRTSANTDGNHGQGTKRKSHDHRRPLCGDQGATRGLLSHRGQRPQRGDSNCRKDSVSRLWKYRGQTSLGVNGYSDYAYGYFPSPHRNGARADDEASVLLYTPAIWQGAHTAESAQRAAAACIRSLLYENRQAG